MPKKRVKKRGVKKFPKREFLKFLIIFLSVILMLVLIFLGILFFKAYEKNKIISCGDGSFYGNCSLIKPYFCDSDGQLIEKASICECSDILTRYRDLCISKYQIDAKEITLKYILDSKINEINFTVYKAMENYLSQIKRSISFSDANRPERRDFKLKNINEPQQRELLLPLITQIQNIAPNNKDNQARVAISLVQNINFGASEKNISFYRYGLNYSRYPYEVLYDNEGVCGEKSELLAFLLRELGYGVVFFYYQEENHEAIGIKCPVEYSLDGSGYCFIETSGPAIITDDKIEYVGGITLNSQPEILFISDGATFGLNNFYEYKDAQSMKKIYEDIRDDGKINFFRSYKLNNLKEKYGLVEEYNV